ncbi:MAG TPA: lysophospholipid acyltransferase family protein [Gammaproteobacteria bacterium]|nr:lysophospholipid acyltransferase family protein [Gammaproteobacteria bacterium]
MTTHVRQWLGSIAFTIYLFLSVPVYGAVALLSAVLPHAATYGIARHWVRSVLRLLRWLCGLDYVVEGREHLPAGSAVVLMKHSSAWETLAQLEIFPLQTWVLKRELMLIPIFGWALRLLKPIAIDRRGGSAAVQQVLTQGRARLDEGLWVVIFPEGTRVPAGETRRYGLSGALLASSTSRPVVPVAHNAGEFWPRRGLLKRRGTVRVVIGPPIATDGVDPRVVNERAQAWIEGKVAEITGRPVARADRPTRATAA